MSADCHYDADRGCRVFQSITKMITHSLATFAALSSVMPDCATNASATFLSVTFILIALLGFLNNGWSGSSSSSRLSAIVSATTFNLCNIWTAPSRPAALLMKLLRFSSFQKRVSTTHKIQGFLRCDVSAPLARTASAYEIASSIWRPHSAFLSARVPRSSCRRRCCQRVITAANAIQIAVHRISVTSPAAMKNASDGEWNIKSRLASGPSRTPRSAIIGIETTAMVKSAMLVERDLQASVSVHHKHLMMLVK